MLAARGLTWSVTMGFGRNQKAKLVGAGLAIALVATAAVIALTSPNANAATPQIIQLCGTALPGQARCLAERQAPTVGALTQGTLPSNGTGPAPAAPGTSVSPSGTPGGYGPDDLASAYQLDTSKGFGQTVAIIDA